MGLLMAVKYLLFCIFLCSKHLLNGAQAEDAVQRYNVLLFLWVCDGWVVVASSFLHHYRPVASSSLFVKMVYIWDRGVIYQPVLKQKHY